MGKDEPELGVSIALISDTHGMHRSIGEVPIADILIHCGDFTRFGSITDAEDFNAWLGELPHKHKIVIEGNHEYNAPWKAKTADLLTNAIFLKNSVVTVANVSIYGKGFFWNMRTKNPYDDLIPEGTHVVVAHNPCRGFVDAGRGCEESQRRMQRLRPRLYACGHIHAARGQHRDWRSRTLFVNASNVAGDHKAKQGTSSYTIQGPPILVRI